MFERNKKYILFNFINDNIYIFIYKYKNKN